MVDPAAWTGAINLVDAYAEATTRDIAILAYSRDSADAAALVSAALTVRGVAFRRVPMRPRHDPAFLERLHAALPRSLANDQRLIVFTFELDTLSHHSAIAQSLQRFDPARCAVFRAISSYMPLFTNALHATPVSLSALNTALLRTFMSGHTLRVWTDSGTDLTITLNNRRHRWISNRGVSRSGGVAILPAGEVATFPKSIEGTLVADFAFNVNTITDIDARLSNHPVAVSISDGRAIDYQCDSPIVRRFLDDCFHKLCAFRVGEVGFGTNRHVNGAIRHNSHINERRPGLHLGFGQHNQDPELVGYQCDIHLDLITRGAQVQVDGASPILDLDEFSPSEDEHPSFTQDQDVFSAEAYELDIEDCCGIVRSDGAIVAAGGNIEH